MAFNIETFRSYFGRQNDFAKANHFEVWINPPLSLLQDPRFKNTLRNDGRGIMEGLSFQVESTELPGRTMSTITPKIYGIHYRTPATTDYTDITMTFISTGRFWERIFFDAWIDFIQPKDTYNFEYRSAYASTIKIYQFNPADPATAIYGVKLLEAFPISVSAQQLNWEGDEIQKLQVVFSYLKWETDFLPKTNIDTQQSTDISNQTQQVPAILSNIVPPAPNGAARTAPNAGGINGQ